MSADTCPAERASAVPLTEAGQLTQQTPTAGSTGSAEATRALHPVGTSTSGAAAAGSTPATAPGSAGAAGASSRPTLRLAEPSPPARSAGQARKDRLCLTCKTRKPLAAFAGPLARRCEECRTAPRFKRCKTCGQDKPAEEYPPRTQKCEACRALPYPSEVAVRERPRGCFRCLEVKPAEAFDWGEGGTVYRRRRAICRKCLEAEEASKRPPQRATWKRANGLLVRRCSSCERVLVLKRHFYISRPDHPGMARWSYYCKRCTSKRTSQANRMALADPATREKMKARQSASRRRWRQRNPGKTEAAHKRWLERVKADPKRWERLRETNRMSYRLRRERREGVKLDAMRVVHPAVERESGGLLPVEPLALAVGALVDAAAAAAQTSVDDAAEAMGVCSRRLRVWRSEEAKTVQLDVADRAMQAVGLLWWEVYDAERWPTAHAKARGLFEGKS